MTNDRPGTWQHQFLQVLDRDEAQRRFQAAARLAPIGEEFVALDECLGRVLAHDVQATVDVPSFDRSNVDGFAVRARDTAGASETDPRRLRLNDETIATSAVPRREVREGTATPIATGAMLPRGADAVIMIEHTDVNGDELMVLRAAAPGNGLSFAGSDLCAGETALRRGDRLTSRETGVLAALGVDRVSVWRRPRVAILSTGDEIIAPGQTMRPGLVFDSNSQILADAVRELGGVPVRLGIVGDSLHQLRTHLRTALVQAEVVLLSGGTSKGAGDVSYQAVAELTDPGIVAHGVALKPGKPLCLAVTQGKPVVVLPGFPTSAVFTFHEFVAPVIRRLAGMPEQPYDQVSARLAVKVNSEAGRTEYLLVGLVRGGQTDQPDAQLAAYPMGKGSGSVTTFSRADGFVTIGRHEELLEPGAHVSVRLLGHGLKLADLVIIGSHCIGLDYLISHMQDRGYRCKFLAVGSTAGLAAAKRRECDLAGIHLLDPASGRYNEPFVTPELELIPGYLRRQGIVFRPGDERFEDRDVAGTIANVLADRRCVMVNRNQGSGTRILIDQLLDGVQPPGYAVQPRSHNAVAAAVAQGRADWGVAIERVARQAGLAFLPVADEAFDFVTHRDRRTNAAVQEWIRLLTDPAVRAELAALGLSSPRE